MTAGGYYSLPSAVTQICVSRQTKTCFSLEAKIDWYMGKFATIVVVGFFPLHKSVFFSNAAFMRLASSSCNFCS